MALPYQRSRDPMQRGPSGGAQGGAYGGTYGGGYGGGYGRGQVDEENQSLLERENNQRWEELSRQTELLKGVTQQIHSEVRSQNDLLDSMGKSMGKTFDLFKGTVSKLSAMLNDPSGQHMWMLVGFIVFVFLLIYFTMGGRK